MNVGHVGGAASDDGLSSLKACRELDPFIEAMREIEFTT